MADKVKVACAPSQTSVTYPIAVTARAKPPGKPRASSPMPPPAGQEILSRYGFQKP